jgi:hypothetical protein
MRVIPRHHQSQTLWLLIALNHKATAVMIGEISP